jgi:uncharacterized integral membrane protein
MLNPPPDHDPTAGKVRAAPPAHRGTGVAWSFVAAVVALVAVVILIVQNDQSVRFEWLWIDFTASLAVMMLLTVLVTVLATSAAGLVWRHRRRRELDDAPPPADATVVRDLRTPSARGGASRP